MFVDQPTVAISGGFYTFIKFEMNWSTYVKYRSVGTRKIGILINFFNN